MVGALLVLLGHADNRAAVGVLPPVLAGFFTFLTGLLLVADLKQPTRFFYILTRPNWSSWLTRGAVILAGYALVGGGWFVAGLAGAEGAIQVLAVPGLVIGGATAGYTAFLFGQCEGRDLWQTPLLLPILLAQAAIAGASSLLVADLFVAVPSPAALRWVLLGATGVAAFLTLTELISRGTAQAHLAVQTMTHGRYAPRFWIGGVVIGMVVPGTLAIVALGGGPAPTGLSAVAGLAAIGGLVAFEDAFVRAGQSVPLS
jgi:formate-dependent nitrite reductase membrane component NrfD